MNLLVEAIVEPVFESPYFAVPYFFFAGIAMAEIARDKAGWVAIEPQLRSAPIAFQKSGASRSLGSK